MAGHAPPDEDPCEGMTPEEVLAYCNHRTAEEYAIEEKRDTELIIGAVNGPTDGEIREITAGMPEVEIQRFTVAAIALGMAKDKVGDTSPWRETLQAFRESGPGVVSIETEDDYGYPIVVEVFVDRGHQLTGPAAEIPKFWQEMADAMERIENFKPAAYINDAVVSAVSRRAKSGQVGEERARAKQRLRDVGYLSLGRGKKGPARKQVADACSLSLRTVDTLIDELKRELQG